MVLDGRDYPPDIRVEKEVRALQSQGHRCAVICENPELKPYRSEWEGSIIFRISHPSFLLRKLNSFFYRAFFFNLQWFTHLLQIGREESLDVIHVHDLRMAGTALWAGKALRIPVIVDLHENLPAALTYYGRSADTLNKKIVALFDSGSRWQRYEKRAAWRADRVIVVVDEAKSRLIKLGIDPQKITVIENTIDVDYFFGLGISDEIVERYDDEFLISYIGGYGGYHRGLDTAVQAMPKVIKGIPQAKLLLVGKGKIKPVLEKMVKDLQIEGHVIFEDWRPFNEVPSYIQASKVCLIPHQSNPHTEATSPHKLFQYMLMERPVVVSSCKPLKRVIEETNGGLVFSAGNSDELAEVLLRLQDENLRLELGRAGKRAVLERYNWEYTSKDLIKLYGNL